MDALTTFEERQRLAVGGPGDYLIVGIGQLQSRQRTAAINRKDNNLPLVSFVAPVGTDHSSGIGRHHRLDADAAIRQLHRFAAFGRDAPERIALLAQRGVDKPTAIATDAGKALAATVGQL